MEGVGYINNVETSPSLGFGFRFFFLTLNKYFLIDFEA